MGAAIVAAIGFVSLAAYIARLAMRGLNGHGTQAERQRPLRHQPPRQQAPAARPRKTA